MFQNKKEDPIARSASNMYASQKVQLEYIRRQQWSLSQAVGRQRLLEGVLVTAQQRTCTVRQTRERPFGELSKVCTSAVQLGDEESVPCDVTTRASQCSQSQLSVRVEKVRGSLL